MPRTQPPTRKLGGDAREQVRRAKMRAMSGEGEMSHEEADEILKRHTGQGVDAYKGIQLILLIKAFPSHRGRPGQRGGSQRGPSTPEEHATRIARDTLRMPDAMAGVMGGPSKEEARKRLGRTPLEYQDPYEKMRQNEPGRLPMRPGEKRSRQE